MNRLEVLAGLLSYPSGDFPALMEAAAGAFPPGDPAGDLFARFREGVAGKSPQEMEELYARTFDFNPDASLETGWQLHGETYERGAYLVRTRAMLRECGVAETAELSDHLTGLLRALGRMPGPEAAAFAADHLSKAVRKMIAAFPDDTNPYLAVLRAAGTAIETVAAPKETARP